MLGTNWRPSVIEDEIYGVMEAYEMGTDLFQEGVIEAIGDYFMNYHPTTNWKLACSRWPNDAGGVCAVSWTEGDYIGMVMFDYWVERGY